MHAPFYKYAFFTTFMLLCATGGYILWNNNKIEQSIANQDTQIAKVTDEKSEIQQSFDAALARLDSVTTQKNDLLIKLKIKNPKDSTIKNLTEPQKRMLRLIDSTNQLRDSINLVGTNIVRILSVPDLDKAQANNLKSTFATLGDISLSLNFALDNQRLDILRDNAASLKALVGSFDKKVEKLDKFSKLLGSFTKYLGVAIDIFAAAVSQGIIVSKQAPLPSK